jgi:hypothetical protein
MLHIGCALPDVNTKYLFCNLCSLVPGILAVRLVREGTPQYDVQRTGADHVVDFSTFTSISVKLKVFLVKIRNTHSRVIETVLVKILFFNAIFNIYMHK